MIPLTILDEPVWKEEVSAILDDIDYLSLNSFEYDFIMDVAEKDWLSSKQTDIVATIYKKYIDAEC